MQSPLNQWSPKDVRKTIILISGILLLVAGIYLFLNQTKAEAIISFKFAGFSGNIHSGSAGVFICVFGLVLFCLASIPIKHTVKKFNWDFLKTNKAIGLILNFILLLVSIIVYSINQNQTFLILIVILALPFTRVLEIK
jgi:Na+/alanine symporter